MCNIRHHTLNLLPEPALLYLDAVAHLSHLKTDAPNMESAAPLYLFLNIFSPAERTWGRGLLRHP